MSFCLKSGVSSLLLIIMKPKCVRACPLLMLGNCCCHLLLSLSSLQLSWACLYDDSAQQHTLQRSFLWTLPATYTILNSNKYTHWTQRFNFKIHFHNCHVGVKLHEQTSSSVDICRCIRCSYFRLLACLSDESAASSLKMFGSLVQSSVYHDRKSLNNCDLKIRIRL